MSKCLSREGADADPSCSLKLDIGNKSLHKSYNMHEWHDILCYYYAWEIEKLKTHAYVL